MTIFLVLLLSRLLPSVFDFDDTLFHTIGPDHGKALHARVTGSAWTLPGWLNHPESMNPEFGITPAPALHAMRDALGRVHNLTIVATGRVETMREPVEAFLRHEALHPDHVFLRPVAAVTADAKLAVVREMFRQHPGITALNVWEDRDDMIATYRSAFGKASHPHLTVNVVDAKVLRPPAPAAPLRDVPCALQLYVVDRGLGRSQEQVSGVLAALGQLNAAWWECLYGPAPASSPYSASAPFLGFLVGSYPLGRSSSDVDVCLLGPDFLDHDAAISRLMRSLKAAGVQFVYHGRSTRCPRLVVRLFPAAHRACELDITFCMVPASMLPSHTYPRELPSVADLDAVQAKLSAQSRLALLGPIVLRDVISVIAACGGTAPMEQRIISFGMVLEVVARMLTVANRSGTVGSVVCCLLFVVCCLSCANCWCVPHPCTGAVFHNIRTRHLVGLLTQHLRSPAAAAQMGRSPPDADGLFMSFVSRLAAMSVEQWTSQLDKFVPAQYIPSVGALFAAADEWLSSSTSSSAPLTPALLEQLLVRVRFPGPPAGFTAVKIMYKCKSSPVALWRLSTFVTGRTQSYLRRLMDKGVPVVPGSAVDAEHGVIRFYVPNTEAAVKQVTRVFTPLGAEVDAFRVEAGAPVSVKIKLHS